MMAVRNLVGVLPLLLMGAQELKIRFRRRQRHLASVTACSWRVYPRNLGKMCLRCLKFAGKGKNPLNFRFSDCRNFAS